MPATDVEPADAAAAAPGAHGKGMMGGAGGMSNPLYGQQPATPMASGGMGGMGGVPQASTPGGGMTPRSAAAGMAENEMLSQLMAEINKLKGELGER